MRETYKAFGEELQSFLHKHYPASVRQGRVARKGPSGGPVQADRGSQWTGPSMQVGRERVSLHL